MSCISELYNRKRKSSTTDFTGALSGAELRLGSPERRRLARPFLARRQARRLRSGVNRCHHSLCDAPLIKYVQEIDRMISSRYSTLDPKLDGIAMSELLLRPRCITASI